MHRDAPAAPLLGDGVADGKAIGDIATMTLVEARSKARTLLAGARKKTRRRRAHRLELSSLERPVMDHQAHVSLRLHKKLLASIDRWTADHAYAAPGGLSRSAAIRMLIEHTLSAEGRYLPGGYRVRLAVEGCDVKRKTPAPKAYGPEASKRAAANAKRHAALLADKYISRDGAPREREPDT